MIQQKRFSFALSLKQVFAPFFQLSKFILAFFRKIFDKKTILFVSNSKIKSYSISTKSQVVILFVILWIGNIFLKSLTYNTNIQKKSAQIKNLEKTNQKFGNEVDSINLDLQKINTYLKNPEDKSSNSEKTSQLEIDNKIVSIFGNIKLNHKAKKVAAKIANSNIILDDIKLTTLAKVNDLEEKLSITGIKIVGNKAFLEKRNNQSKFKEVISLNDKNDKYKKQGGPFLGAEKLRYTTNQVSLDQKETSLEDNIKKLVNLENFIQKAPLSPPMVNYYVSSGFGKRSDPIKQTLSFHEGMDFVGKSGANVVSPAQGKVIFAGKFSTYGNILIIDHGYGITTRYGHLAKIYVDKGSVVKQDQLIATQGTTGRSTGEHLHYEVRYNNIPLDPKKFLQAGLEINRSNGNIPIRETRSL